ncbi:hypothetical protein DXG01_017242, partial [Tephrocybe rancida]
MPCGMGFKVLYFALDFPLDFLDFFLDFLQLLLQCEPEDSSELDSSSEDVLLSLSDGEEFPKLLEDPLSELEELEELLSLG